MDARYEKFLNLNLDDRTPLQHFNQDVRNNLKEAEIRLREIHVPIKTAVNIANLIALPAKLHSKLFEIIDAYIEQY